MAAGPARPSGLEDWERVRAGRTGPAVPTAELLGPRQAWRAQGSTQACGLTMRERWGSVRLWAFGGPHWCVVRGGRDVIGELHDVRFF